MSETSILMEYCEVAGIRFRPTDEELIVYLAEKDTNKTQRSNVIINYDVYSCPPWLLPRSLFEYSNVQNDMYFISERRPKTKGSNMVDRNAGTVGYWHYNSQQTPIKNCHGEVIGIKTSLNYMKFEDQESDYDNPNNKKKRTRTRTRKEDKEKTSWIMHEYILESSSDQGPTKFQDVVLCHIIDNAQDKQPKRITIIDDTDEEEEEEEEEEAPELDVSVDDYIVAEPLQQQETNQLTLYHDQFSVDDYIAAEPLQQQEEANQLTLYHDQFSSTSTYAPSHSSELLSWTPEEDHMIYCDELQFLLRDL